MTRFVAAKPRRIAGVNVAQTGEKRFCSRCRCEQPTAKAVVRIAARESVSIFCLVCDKHLSCYPIKNEPKEKP